MSSKPDPDKTSLGDVFLITAQYIIGITNLVSLLLSRRAFGVDNIRQYYWHKTSEPVPGFFTRWLFPLACFSFIWCFAYMMPEEWLKTGFLWLAYFVTGRAYLILLNWEFSNKNDAKIPSTSLGFNSFLPYAILNEDDPNTFVGYSNIVEPVLYFLLMIVFCKFHLVVLGIFCGLLGFGLAVKIFSIRETTAIRDVDVRNKWLMDLIFRGKLNKGTGDDSPNTPDQDAPVM